MYSHINFLIEQGLFNFFHKQAFASDFRKSNIKNLVTFCYDFFYFKFIWNT